MTHVSAETPDPTHFEKFALEFAGHLREASTEALQGLADEINDPDIEYTGDRPDLSDAECTVNAHMLAAVLDDWGKARAERNSALAEVERLRTALESLDVQELPIAFKFTGTNGRDLENMFDAEMRHKTGSKPIDYLMRWLPMFRPFAFASRDDSWGELEKLISTTMRNYVQALEMVKNARAALQEKV